jgi:hypothetical protein
MALRESSGSTRVFRRKPDRLVPAQQISLRPKFYRGSRLSSKRKYEHLRGTTQLATEASGGRYLPPDQPSNQSGQTNIRARECPLLRSGSRSMSHLEGVMHFGSWPRPA